MGSLYDTLFNSEESPLEKKRRTIRQNRKKGKVGENFFIMRHQLHGYRVERTGRGSDFYVEKRNVFGNVTDSKTKEVKTGNPKLSKLQEETRRKKGRHYKLERMYVPPIFYQDI